MTFLRLLRAGFHTLLLFVLPWGVGAVTGLLFDVGEVEETLDAFARWFGLLAVPLMLLQLVAIVVKISRERRAMAARGRRGFGAFVEAVDKHVRVLTGRGVGLALSSGAMVTLALAAKWGQFAVVAVAGLGVLYIFSTAATFASAFSIRAFDDRLRRGRGTIDREMSPAVVDAGDAVEERFVLARIPVFPGFRLHIDESLPDRLGTETRFAVDRVVSRSVATLSAPLARTARGVYRLGPASIWYEDLLGVTRVAIASHACANLRVLPRLRPVLMEKKPRSLARAEGPLAALARVATEDHYRTRPYVAGDDVRRVHWKLSINTGALQIRVPESIPYAPRKVRLFLDTHLPHELRVARPVLGDALDLLVEGWVGLAHALVQRGERVSLVVAVPAEDGASSTLRELACRRGEERLWRSLGADAVWQHDLPFEAALARLSASDASAIVVTGALAPVSSIRGPEATVITIDTADLVEEPPRDGRSLVLRAMFHDHPAGSDDNRIDWRALFTPKPRTHVIRRDVGARTRGVLDGIRGAGLQVLRLSRKGPNLGLERP